METENKDLDSVVHRSAASVISNNVLAERLQERLETLAEEQPELFISKEEAEAVGYRAEDELKKTQQDLAEEDAETELVLAAQEV